MSNHGEGSVHGKLDNIMECQKQLVENQKLLSDSQKNMAESQKSLADRQKVIEDAIIGTPNAPGLCEKVRVLQSENAKQAVIISTGISAMLMTAWSFIKSKLGMN